MPSAIEPGDEALDRLDIVGMTGSPDDLTSYESLPCGRVGERMGLIARCRSEMKIRVTIITMSHSFYRLR